MDKYEYNLKLEEIDRLVDQEDYKEAANLADTIDWRRVRNIRTLCLISEIYEAAGRLKDSKDMLVRAYRKIPVGRTVLYRLVEVTTALRQYDEALEYYTEYVQAAPHDNNRYILKYMIYRGRGSQPEELIDILKEYLEQEYTERWAYELATLYRQAGQMQNCLAVCDDLVLWFHTGKYVKKALELKRRYAVLTPRQQQIYEECLQGEARQDYLDQPETEEEEHLISGADGEVIAETIMSETEKEIADEISARKAEMDKAAAAGAKSGGFTRLMPRLHFGRREKKQAEEKSGGRMPQDGKDGSQAEKAGPEASENASAEAGKRIPEEGPAAGIRIPEGEPEASGTEIPEGEPAAAGTEISAGVRIPEGEPAAAGTEIPAGVRIPEGEPAAAGTGAPEAEKAQAGTKVPAGEPEAAKTGTPEGEPAPDVSREASYGPDSVQFQEELARSVRQIVSGVARRPELNEDDVPAVVVEDRLNRVQKLSIPEVREPEAGKLSIDDILLSMSEKGKRLAEEARRASGQPGEDADAEAAETGREEQKTETREGGAYARSIAEASAADLTDEQLEALHYSDNPQRFLKKRGALPTYSSDEMGKTRKIINTKEELIEAARREILATETIRIPVEEIAQNRANYRTDKDVQNTQPQGDSAPEPENMQYGGAAVKAEADGYSAGGGYAEEDVSEAYGYSADGGYAEEDVSEADGYSADGGYAEEDVSEADGFSSDDGYAEEDYAEEEYPENDGYEEEEYPEDEDYEEDDILMIPEHLRGLFGGFTEISGLEEQIANAILQAESRGNDRTSRTGNILIFGAHGSGKTTLATGIAKAVAQDRNSQVLKLARIYAADLNRKDIAATIAKISGGTLIIEEAGDLEDEIVEQLTTAMEFRTDGLTVILEDEQRYVHELLMKHPRFTMKFTAQIYLPVYTAEELGMFGQRYARAHDYVIAEEGLQVICSRISEAAAEGKEMSIENVIDMTEKAIRRSNRFFRKLFLGKKRYDEDDFAILFAKDFK